MRLLTVAMSLVALTTVTSAAPEVSRLKLRSNTTIYGDRITLGDVLVLTAVEPRLAELINEEAVGLDAQPGRSMVVTHDQVVRRLDELGVNLSHVLVGGALQCEVSMQTPEPAPNDGRPAVEDAVVRTATQHDPSSGETLADVLRAYANEELAELGGQAELQFDRAGEEFLELTTPPWEFRVSSSGTDQLGLREFRVVIRRDGRTQRTARVYAHVKLIREVVVARRPLSIGVFIAAGDVGLETRVFDHGDKLGIADLQEVVGQQVKRFIPRDDLVEEGAIKNVDLVRRSRPVTVLSTGDHVHLRLTGVALDSGMYGETVRVRLGDARRSRQTVRGLVTGLGTVRLTEENR